MHVCGLCVYVVYLGLCYYLPRRCELINRCRVRMSQNGCAVVGHYGIYVAG